jgi:hypothetical protein
MLGVGGLAIDASKLEKHLDRHGVASSPDPDARRRAGSNDTILRGRSQAWRALSAAPVARMTDS